MPYHTYQEPQYPMQTPLKQESYQEEKYNKSLQYQIQDVIELELKAKLNVAKESLAQVQKDTEMSFVKNIKARDEYIHHTGKSTRLRTA
jgi:hypothetical protein